MKTLRLLFALLACMLLAGHATAQFPNKTIHLIVPSGPGGAPDIRARQIAPLLAQAVGQPVVVENKTGAQGMIGAREAAKAAPDGHTLFLGNGQLVLSDLLNPDPTFRGVREFDPITAVTAGPLLWVASATLEACTLGEGVALARLKPGRLTYASQGPGSFGQLAALMVEQAAGISMLEVPYKTGAQEFPDLISGEIATSFAFYSAVLPHLQSGRVRALAVASQQRLAVLPQVPTFAEAGLPGVEAKGWQGIFVPAGTPKEVIARLHQELARIFSLPEIRDPWIATGAEIGGNTPEQFAAYIRDETERWGKLIRERGITVK